MSEVWNRFGPTAAREHGKPGRAVRPSSITIDVHSHVAVPEAASFVKPHLDLMSIPLVSFATPETRTLNQQQDAARTSRMTQYDERLADLEEMGVDLQVIKPLPPQCYYTVPIEIADKASRMVNDTLAEYAARKPDRFVVFGTVPLQDGAAAAAELERSVKQLGFKGVQVLTNVAGKELSDPAFAPFWAKAEQLGVLVVLHPNGFTQAERLTRYYFNNVVGNPFDTSVALHYLIFDGVLERHPNLKILAVHGGGYLASYSGRIDHAWGARSDCRGTLPKPPTSYLKKNVYVDSVVFTPHQLKYLVEVFGADKILMGTDYPYDMAESDPIGHLASAGLDAATVAAIAGGNVRRLLNL
ncbi:MAG: amidohydrolase family protein [Xanthobacteraceae bacterium]|jgi:aminocarboxymuconate-semialdehyde decarboxylase